jgi:hypothetical protein
MKTLTQIIEASLGLNLKPLGDPTKDSNNKILKQNKLPTKGHRYAGPRLGAPTASGAAGRVSRIRKDTSAAYMAAHPGQFGVSGNKKIISPQQAQQMVDPKVNIQQAIRNKKAQKWGISNSQKKHVEFHPNIGPRGTFFEVT